MPISVFVLVNPKWKPGSEPDENQHWVEVYLDGKWFTVDARHNQPRIGRALVARGRDASDIPLFSTFGPHQLNRFEVWTEEYKGLHSNISNRTRSLRLTTARYGPAGRSPNDLGLSQLSNALI